MERRIIETQVAIIGAGFSGIAAAKKLFEAGKSFQVIEARNRIGGRTLSKKLDSGVTVDLGAQWIGPDQLRVWKWVDETSAPTFPCFDSGKNLLSYNNNLTRYSGTIPKIDPLSLIDLGLAINKVNRLSAQVSLESPWSHPKALKFDSMTVQSWMDSKMLTRKAKFLFSIGIETVFAAKPAEVSFLSALFYAHSGKDMDALISVTGGAQQTLLNRGTQDLLNRVARPFEDQILLDNPVREIRYDADGVSVLSDQLEIRADYAVLTVPPPLIRNIRFDPILPQMKGQLYQRLPMGAAMKCFCIYRRPFWRTQGLSGQIVSDRFPVKVTFDCSRSDDSHGILLIFVEAQNAREFIELPKPERKQMILEKLVEFLGSEAADPIEYIDKCWTEEEWSGGCYAAISPPGVITQFKDTIRQPVGRLRFAGTETATEWNGYLDGAIQSGYREAGAILQMRSG